ncbi:MAG: 1-acyl-sn-glycerol-3-phosphate acyltransferase [Bacteroidetes bacterium]|nr:1-acyl-sn-glycerol-3-phosphate acyltransferase [Bacteroidota bacterium]
MIRTIIFFVYFWTFLILSLFIYGFFELISLVFPKRKKKILLMLVQWWARNILRIGGVKINITGADNIPQHEKVCFVSNHQSNYDIACVIVSIPMIIGFIAKMELQKYLPLRVWMDKIGCVFINRKKPKESIKKVEQRILNIQNNNPLLIFPEGTRSKSRTMQQFKTGGLKLLVEHQIEIVPVTIQNSYLRYEQNKRISPGVIHIIIHPPVNPKNEDTQANAFSDKLYKIIETGL